MCAVKRRDFLKVAAATSVAVSGCGRESSSSASAIAATSSPKPEPAAQLPPPASSPPPQSLTLPPAPAGTVNLTGLTIATPLTTAQPFTVGQLFRKGDVPGNTALTASVPQFQADVRNRWADGSVRFAVLSGIAPRGVVAIRKGETSKTADNVAEPSVNAVVTFTSVTDSNGSPIAGGAFSAQLTAARTNSTSTWLRSKPHKVRQILGPVMSEFHYVVPTSDAHTTVWFYVRAYVSGHVEIETVVENGWLLVAAPGQRTYNVSVSIDGTQRFNATGVNHYHHTRWSRVDWAGTDPQVTVTHDVAYLKAVHGIPKTAVSSLNAAAYANFPEFGTRYTSWTRTLAEQPTPFSSANIDTALGAGGFTDNANLFAAWDMTYLVEGDARAYWAIQGNMRAGGRFCVHYRDENHGGVARGSQHPTLCLHDTNVGLSDNAGNSKQLTPAPSGGEPKPLWYYSHGPSLGFMAYVTSGRWSAWEETQFYSSTVDFHQGNNVHNGYRIGPYWDQLRVHAWKFRARAQAAIIAPQFLNGIAVTGEDAQQRTEALGRLNADVAYYHAAYVANSSAASAAPRQLAQNVFGLWYQHQDYDESNDTRYTVGGMMQSFNCLSVMWAYAAEASTDNKLAELAAFCARFPVGMLGGAPGGKQWDHRVFSFYQAPFGTGGLKAGDDMGPTAMRSSWDAMWTYLTTQVTWQPRSPFPLPADNYLRNITPHQSSTTDYAISPPQITLALGSSNVVASAACVALAHEIAATLPIAGATIMAAHFYGSDTWLNTISRGAFQDNPQWAYQSKRV